MTPLKSHTPKIATNTVPTYEISKLANGVTIVTEKESFPSLVSLTIGIKVGSRNETLETSGSLLSMKNTYYKSLIKTNETINFGMV